MRILLADESHVTKLAPLFDAYRVFYRKDSDVDGAAEFLMERLVNQESIILMAVADDDAETCAGFTQLYPSFSSVSMKPIWILNDLYVASTHRRQGVAQALLSEAANFARQDGAIRLVLETEVDNKNAIALYEKESWIKDSGHHYFELELG